MRGSPIIRFILLAVALVVTALGLLRVTAARSSGDPSRPSSQKTPTTSETTIPFRLLLSAPAATIQIDTGRETLVPSPTSSALSGILRLDPLNPHVALIIRWKQAALPGEHRFAKLTLEVPGQPTLHHSFDSTGDIDDFLELPSSVTEP